MTSQKQPIKLCNILCNCVIKSRIFNKHKLFQLSIFVFRNWKVEEKHPKLYIIGAVVGGVAITVLAVALSLLLCKKTKQNSIPAKVSPYEMKDSKDGPPAYDCTDLGEV